MGQLVPLQAEFEALNTEVAVVSFSNNDYWARTWLEQTGSPYRLLLDRDREIYRVYGLSQNVWRAWGPKTLWYYARAILQGERLHGIESDSTQLGGNFIVDRGGVLRYIYHSMDPTDRPPVNDLLNELRALT